MSLAGILAAYGGYHRDPRNRRTHYVGVPAIVYALLVPAALCVPSIFGAAVGLHWILVAALALFYLSLDRRLGLALAAALALLAWAAQATAGAGTGRALSVAGVVFVLGWALQLLGHHLEGNRPALLDNVLQIFIAPIYLIAELAFALGLRAELRIEIETRLASASRH